MQPPSRPPVLKLVSINPELPPRGSPFPRERRALEPQLPAGAREVKLNQAMEELQHQNFRLAVALDEVNQRVSQLEANLNTLVRILRTQNSSNP
jgi:hypothetical protein